MDKSQEYLEEIWQRWSNMGQNIKERIKVLTNNK